jgi:hypothetical protein
MTNNRPCRKCADQKIQAPVINGIKWVTPKGSPGGRPRPVVTTSPAPATPDTPEPSPEHLPEHREPHPE